MDLETYIINQIEAFRKYWADPEKKEHFLRIGRNSLIGAVLIMALYAWVHDGFRPSSFASLFLTWADSITISGIMMLIITATVKLGRIGGFWDWASYSLYRAHCRFENEEPEHTNYAEYCETKERSDWPLIPLLGISLAFFCAGCLLSALYVAIF